MSVTTNITAIFMQMQRLIRGNCDWMFQVLRDKIAAYSDMGCHVLVAENPLSVVVVTPIMSRAHTLQQSSGICFVDTTASCDSQNLSVTFMLAPCAAGAVPLAVIITDSQSEASYSHGFEMLKNSGLQLFGGSGYPEVFMTDDSTPLHNALHAVWPFSQQTLCLFHVPQANWRWLWDSSNNIAKTDRPALMAEFQRIMLSTDIIEAEEQFRSGTSSRLAKKYPQWKHRLETYWLRKERWCLAYRSAVQRGHQTNNFSEVTVRLFKDIVLSRAKAYNAVSLVDFICTAMEQYYSRRLLDFAHSRVAGPTLWLGRLVKKAEYVESGSIITVSDAVFHVPSSSDSSMLYTVDVVNGVCSYVDGMFGRFCKHQAAVMQHKPGLFSYFDAFD